MSTPPSNRLSSITTFAAGFILGATTWFWHAFYLTVIAVLSVIIYLK